MLGPQVIYIFNFIENCPNCFSKVIVSLCTPTFRVGELQVHSPHQHLILSVFLMKPVGGKWYLNVVLIGASLMTLDAGHLFMCLLATCMSSFMKEPFKPIAQSLLGCFSCFTVDL